MMNRRTFLAGLGAGVGAALLGRDVVAGNPATGDEAFASPGTPYKILEIFLYGGLSPWESFYCVPGERPQLYTGALATNYTSVEVATGGACTAVPNNPLAPLTGGTYRFGDLRLGKGARPLVARHDMLSRTRVVSMRSDISNHVLGIPQAITGRRFGDPRAVSLGAAVQRRHATDGPVSFVVMPPPTRFFGGESGDYRAFDAFFATGNYPASSRPIRLNLGASNDLAGWAARASRGDATDALARDLAGQYRGRFGATRARTAASFESVVQSMGYAPDLVGRYSLANTATMGIVPASHCLPGGDGGTTATRASLGLARDLFASGAKYVAVVDTGIGQDNGAGYDGHNNAAEITTPNLYHLLNELASIVRTGSGGSGISLDDTLIVLNTEMGRTAEPQGTFGRDHYGAAYACALIGGPITSARGATMRGTFALDGDRPVGTYTPANLVSSLMRAAGVDEALPENFAASERTTTLLS